MPSFSFAAVFNVTTSSELQNALNTASSNGEDDTINIASGTYTTPGAPFTYIPASPENFSVTIIGAGAGSTILDGGGITQVLNIDNINTPFGSNANVTIMNLTIQNGNGTDATGSGECNQGKVVCGGGLSLGTGINNSSSVTIKNCTFSNNSANASGGAEDNGATGGGAQIFVSGGALTLTNNIFDNNSANASGGVAFGGGAEIITFGSITLTNNIFDHNSATSSGNDATGGGADIVTESGGTITLTNNAFTLNSTSGVGTFPGVGGGLFAIALQGVISIYNNILFNNTATGNGKDIFVLDNGNSNNTGSPVNFFNNDFSDFFSLCENTTGCTPNINRGSNINADPLFVNAAAGDVHLTANSPAINAGDPNAPDLPATDFDGNPRIVGSAPDMGAFEFIPPPNPPSESSGGTCSLAIGSPDLGNAAANVLIPLIPGLAVGIKALRRRVKKGKSNS